MTLRVGFLVFSWNSVSFDLILVQLRF
uniref:Uncharacterized protein n=1 Tax=Rhizophora mucronata TaxID=61149 RepID=A0A2P2NRU6_RHIMU